MADKWNHPSFLPITTALPGIHSEFAWPIRLVFDTVSHIQPATAEMIEETWQAMNLQLNGVSNWKCSGQEGGGFIEQGDSQAHNEYDDRNEENVTEYEFGSIRNCPQ